MVWFCSVHDLGLLWNYFLWFLLLIFNGIYNLLILFKVNGGSALSKALVQW
jgi:hypothetical protein